MRSQLFIIALSFLILLPAAHAANQEDATPKMVNRALLGVNCDAGQSVQQKIDRLRIVSPLEIVFSGTCDEQITISRDDLTLRGANADAAFTQQVAVVNSVRVALKDFTVRDTPGGETPIGDGIKVIGSTGVALSGLTIQDTGRRAISVEHSAAEVSDVTILRTSGNSLIAIGSELILGGTIVADGTNHAGIHIGFGSSLFINENTSIVSKNAVIGMLVQINSTMTVSDGSDITLTDNQFIGLQISNNASVFLGLSDLVSMNNGVAGILVGNHGVLGVFVENTASVTSSNNGGGGIWAVRNATVNLTSETVVADNGGPGILAKESSIVIGGTTSTGNFPDVLLTYMARANFVGGNTFATPVVCDGFVLTEGDSGCPDGVAGGASVDFASVLASPELQRVLTVRD